MARSRMMPPTWCKDELLAECTPAARLLFRDLHGLADRLGRLEYRPKWIKAEVFPYDDLDIHALLAELLAADFVRCYRVAGRDFLYIPAFSRTQRPHLREAVSEIPEPPKTNLGDAQHLPRLVKGSPSQPESVIESESAGKSDSVPVFVSSSEREKETESPLRGKTVDRANTKNLQNIEQTARQMFVEISVNQDEETLIDSLIVWCKPPKPSRAECRQVLQRVLSTIRRSAG